jgi:uncharacterized membrane protein HdeD (DUF308 family)
MNETTAPLLSILTRNWWVMVLRGVLALIFGVIALTAPFSTLAVLVFVFGAYAFVDGVFALITGIQRHHEHQWWALLLEGLAGIATGVVVFLWPQISALALLYVIAFWAMVTGILELALAIRLHRHWANEVLLFLSGIASVLLGVLMIARPGAGALALAWMIGVYALIFGGLLIGAGFRAHALAPKRAMPPATPTAPHAI